MASVAQTRVRMPYTPLRCGHYSTPDADLAYALWKPKRGAHYCETCSAWSTAMPRPKPPVTDTPMF